MLGDNLVLRLKDYEADQHFLTFLGQDRVTETVRTLLAYARGAGLPAELRLVPETVIESDPHLSTCFSVTADPDNFDYVYDAGDWAHFATAGFREHRRLVARCREQTDLEFRRFDPYDPHAQAAIFDLFRRWVEQKPVAARGDPEQERTALCRLTALAGDNTLAAGGFFDGVRLVGFSLWEGLLGRDFAVIHFQKTDRDYRGLSSWQPHAMGRLLLESGYRFINGEQDLGIRGLRIHKRSFQPCQFLRKYVIAERGS
jgi:hypothetical protein